MLHPPDLPTEIPPVQPVSACPNCGEELAGRFCAACGEEKGIKEDYSLRKFLGEAFIVMTSVESGLFRTFKALLTKPGLLTAEYLAGRRKRYLKPLQLFLFCNVFFFLLQSYNGYRALTTPLNVHVNGMPYSTYARRMVINSIRRSHITPKEYQLKFDAAIENQAKTLIIVMVPMLALVMTPLFRRPRRYFVEHLVFATHFYSFFLLVFTLVMLLTTAALHALTFTRYARLFISSDLYGGALLMLLNAVYLTVATRRVYGQSRAATAFKCFLMTVSLVLILQLYRFVLFFTTYYSV